MLVSRRKGQISRRQQRYDQLRANGDCEFRRNEEVKTAWQEQHRSSYNTYDWLQRVLVALWCGATPAGCKSQ